LADEVRYIQRCAAQHEGRFVTVGALALFSTDTGDAWLLDPADRLAARLAREGDPEPIYIEETDKSFAIGWKGSYRIEGQAFVYLDRDAGRIVTILGYPTDRIAQLSPVVHKYGHVFFGSCSYVSIGRGPRVQPVQQRFQIASGELPLERLSDLFVVALEAQDALA
jgi:hypothetical protein